MARFLKPSRIVAVALILVAGAWIGSGMIAPHAQEAAKPEPAADQQAVRQKVGFTQIAPQSRNQTILLSGVTQADRRAVAAARGAGTVRELQVVRGKQVKAGDVIALLSDEGREAAVRQAQTAVDQRQNDLNAQRQLIQNGTLPRNQLNALEAALAAAQAALATAQAEAEKVRVLAPIDGLVDSIPIEVGQAVQVGTQIAEVIGPDPMLAVGFVSEKDRASVKVGNKVDIRFIDGRTKTGALSFVALAGEKATRTYRVEARMPNPDASVADGVTCEITITLDPIMATPIPRSAILFSDTGELGVRIVDANSQAKFIPVSLVEDERSTIWVRGIDAPIKLITVGQNFVKDGDPVDATPDATAAGVKS